MKMLAAAFSILTLTACGGGGGGNSTTGNNANDASGHLTVSGLQLKSTDVIANTKNKAQTVSSASILGMIGRYAAVLVDGLIPDAHAVSGQSSYPPASYDPAFEASRKLVDGKLLPLNPVVKYFEKDTNGNEVEKNIQCDLTSAEIRIQKSFELNTPTEDFLIQAETPDSVDKNCKITLKNSILYVKGDSSVFNVTNAFSNPIVDVIPANDPAFNKSDTPLIVDSTGLIKFIELMPDGSLRAVDLNTVSAPIYTNYAGAFAYDGNKLFGASNTSVQSATYFAFQRGSTEFKIFKPADGSSNGYLSTILDDQGRILFHYASGGFQVLNTVDWSYQPLLPTFIGEFGMPVRDFGFPMGMYGAQGRYGKWILSDRGTLWNYDTKAALCLVAYPDTELTLSHCGSGTPKYVRLWGHFAYAVDNNMDNFVRFDINTGTGVSVSLNSKGYLAKSFQVFKNSAMVEIVNAANSDKKFVENNFETGAVTDRGVISLGNRTVDTFTSIGKGA